MGGRQRIARTTPRYVGPAWHTGETIGSRSVASAHAGQIGDGGLERPNDRGLDPVRAIDPPQAARDRMSRSKSQIEEPDRGTRSKN
jgi:hypothetical protein